MRIAGVDEVGRGPLAGPVCAAAVVLPPGYQNSSIQDSKKLTPRQREALVPEIKRIALSWAIVSVGHHRIESLNIREASRVAMSLAVKRVQADLVLVDGNVPIEVPIPQRTIVGGDASVIQISAASILAKVWRDHLMAVLDGRYPQYGFKQHAGYPTSSHRAAIRLYGPCNVHRRTFRGVVEYLGLASAPNGASPAS
ncbi:MAG: ribonuclease HII [Bdellovibrionota bacterium]|nr:MAG: ribonuclease HII [Bdellovibrionota bacterium]